jgi:hypothetical protein
VSEALADPSPAKRVSLREGRTIKSSWAGIFLIGCESMERAIEVAVRTPEAPIGEIEVRPIMDLGDLEM